MSVFLRYLASMLLHLMWRRAGKGGPLPPVRLPGKGPVNLPVLGPWQMMVAMWLANKVWEKYGREVKTHLMSTGHPAARGIGSMLPDPKNAAPGNNASTHAAASAPASVAAPNAQPAPGVAGSTHGTAPRNPATAHNTASHDTASHDTASHDTQPLPGSRLPSGSILSGLRRSSSKSQPAQG